MLAAAYVLRGMDAEQPQVPPLARRRLRRHRWGTCSACSSASKAARASPRAPACCSGSGPTTRSRDSSARRVWVVAFKAWRYVSLASILGSVAFAVAYVVHRARARWDVLGTQLPLLVFAFLMAGLIVFKHRSNIARLRAGTELRAGGAARRGARVGERKRPRVAGELARRSCPHSTASKLAGYTGGLAPYHRACNTPRRPAPSNPSGSSSPSSSGSPRSRCIARSAGGKDRIPWRTDVAAAVADGAGEEAGAALLHGVWCGPCQRMKGATWSDAAVEAKLQGYVPVKVDIDHERGDRGVVPDRRGADVRACSTRRGTRRSARRASCPRTNFSRGSTAVADRPAWRGRLARVALSRRGGTLATAHRVLLPIGVSTFSRPRLNTGRLVPFCCGAAAPGSGRRTRRSTC